MLYFVFIFFFFQAEDGIRDKLVTGVQTCALPISAEQEPDDVDDTAEQAHLDADDHQERAVALEARGLRGVGPDELDETEHQVALEVDEERHVQRARGGHESPIRVRDAAEEQGRWPRSEEHSAE